MPDRVVEALEPLETCLKAGSFLPTSSPYTPTVKVSRKQVQRWWEEAMAGRERTRMQRRIVQAKTQRMQDTAIPTHLHSSARGFVSGCTGCTKAAGWMCQGHLSTAISPACLLGSALSPSLLLFLLALSLSLCLSFSLPLILLCLR